MLILASLLIRHIAQRRELGTQMKSQEEKSIVFEKKCMLLHYAFWFFFLTFLKSCAQVGDLCQKKRQLNLERANQICAQVETALRETALCGDQVYLVVAVVLLKISKNTSPVA